jgi:hypothetical protein
VADRLLESVDADLGLLKLGQDPNRGQAIHGNVIRWSARRAEEVTLKVIEVVFLAEIESLKRLNLVRQEFDAQLRQSIDLLTEFLIIKFADIDPNDVRDARQTRVVTSGMRTLNGDFVPLCRQIRQPVVKLVVENNFPKNFQDDALLWQGITKTSQNGFARNTYKAR